MAINTLLNEKFIIETSQGQLPQLNTLVVSGLTAGAANIVPHGLPTGRQPLFVDLAPSALGLWGETQPSDPSQVFALTSVAISTGVYTGTISNGNQTTGLTLTQVIGASSTYVGTITGGANNAFQGMLFSVTGFTASAGANNGIYVCTASSATQLVLANSGATNETHAGTATYGPNIGAYFTVAGFGNSNNNGTFQCSACSLTTLTLVNTNSVAQTSTTATATGGFIYITVGAGGATYGRVQIIA